MFARMNHHLVGMLQRHIQSNFAEQGYETKMSPEIEMDHPDGRTLKINPAMAVYAKGSDKPAMLVDVDIQACGRQEYFTERVQAYEAAQIPEHWLFFTKDHIIVVRRLGEDGYGKPKIHGEEELLVPGGIFPEI